MRGRDKAVGIVAALLVAEMFGLSGALAQEVPTPALPEVSIQVGDSDLTADGTLSATIKVVILVSLISFAPAIMLTATCFTRIAVVLGMTRQALGTQQLPPNMVVNGIAMFLTISIMAPVFEQMYQEGARPFFSGEMDQRQALDKTIAPLKRFLLRHARDKDIALFLDISKTERPETVDEVPIYVAVPAFVLSELNTAFQIGFLIALPFLVLDMVVSSVLTSMSMITLPPVVISLPLKLMLFVLVDGWHLIISSVIQTYQVT